MNTLAGTENRVLMSQAREALMGKWGLAVGTMVVYMVIIIAIPKIHKVGTGLFILIAGPMATGLASFALAFSRKQDAKLSQIFSGFHKFGVALGAFLLRLVFTVLWLLLLIIPGIIAWLSYSMTFFIIADDDAIGPLEAITKSKEMMRGNKWKLCCLIGRFIVWFLMGILTFGIGLLWVVPYWMVSYAQFYDDLKKNAAPAAIPV